MPRGRPKKTISEPALIAEDTEILVETPVILSSLERAVVRQSELLELRNLMVSEGVDSISKLDALLGQVNQQVKELSL